MTTRDQAFIDEGRAALQTLGSARGPIIVGPWLSEIGFELLYWIPFLRWAIATYGLRTEDLVIVSRGGARSWYQEFGTQYLDVLDVYSPAEFIARNAARIESQCQHWQALGMKVPRRSPKQQEVSAFDEAILAQVQARTGPARLLHPSLMYRYFRPFWKRKALRLYDHSTLVRRLQAPRLPGLPASYVAMKFYSSAALPDTPEHRRMVQDIVSAQLRTSDVVLLHSGTQYDDHGEFPIDAHPRVHRVALPPAQNLDIQTAIVGGASRFVGTYGGFSYVAPFLGVPTIALYGASNFRRDHKSLIQRLSQLELSVPLSIDHLYRGRGLVTGSAVRRAA